MEYMDYEQNRQSESGSKKMGIADRFITAMFLPKEYGSLLRLKAGKIISYLILLILLTSLIQYAIPALGAITGLGGLKNIILNEIPDFALEEGKFSFGEKLERKDTNLGVYVLVDTDKEKFTKDDIPDGMMEAVLVSSTNILLYNNVAGIGGMLQEDTFDHYKSITITNQTIANGVNWIYAILILLFVSMYIGAFIKYLFAALLYSAVMYLLSKTMMMELTYGTVYKIALFAQSVGAIVMAVVYCIGSPLFILTGSAFNMLVTVILMNKALVQMKLENEAL
ncbi:MAG: DUF1189 domain-containing protein [Lachnospiraceae bacterium]|nr:DUF1189 domain-containing protein [Lachnospiraceae bacterium]